MGMPASTAKVPVHKFAVATRATNMMATKLFTRLLSIPNINLLQAFQILILKMGNITMQAWM